MIGKTAVLKHAAHARRLAGFIAYNATKGFKIKVVIATVSSELMEGVYGDDEVPVVAGKRITFK